MYSIFIAATVLIIGVIGQNNNFIRNFAPSVPAGRYSSDRIWIQLSESCFAQESSVTTFTNFLLTKYPCISIDNTRPEIYSYDTFWSLWFEKNDNFADFSCLNTPINLPNVASSCIDYIYYESILVPIAMNTYDCTSKDASDPKWSLDILDGSFYDNKYDHPYWGDLEFVELIVLDTGIFDGHSEFSKSNPECLSNNYWKCTSRTLEHGTAVASTIVGMVVGGATTTKLWYYPVCRLRDGSCRQRDIEDGYELAIKHMKENPTKSYVINFSVSGPASDADKIYYDAIGIKIIKARGIWVVGAGNDGVDACNYAPAFSEYAITVGAYDKDYRKLAYDSNWGTCVDFYGPGVDIYCATPSDNGYTIKSGTSMASANIAAIVINRMMWFGEDFWVNLDTEYGIKYIYLGAWMTHYSRCVDAQISMIQPFTGFCTMTKEHYLDNWWAGYICQNGYSVNFNYECQTYCGCNNPDGTQKDVCDYCCSASNGYCHRVLSDRVCTDEYNRLDQIFADCYFDPTGNCQMP